MQLRHKNHFTKAPYISTIQEHHTVNTFLPYKSTIQ